MRIVTVSRKPCAEGSVTQNVAIHGAGALNIEACRLPFVDVPDMKRRQPHFDSMGYQGTKSPTDGIELYKEGGRWPANVVLTADAVSETGLTSRYFKQVRP